MMVGDLSETGRGSEKSILSKEAEIPAELTGEAADGPDLPEDL